MRVLVCGGRTLDSEQVCKWLEDNLRSLVGKPTFIIDGGAPGADLGAFIFTARRGYLGKSYHEVWNKYQDDSGPIRNQHILSDSKPDVVVAFPGASGTLDMKARAREMGIRVIEAHL